jgi:trehalose-phosphatase
MDAAAIAAEIGRRRNGRHLLVLLDFDGTLCAFDPEPQSVRLTPEVRTALADLSERSDTTVGYISGRRIADLKSRVPSAEACYFAGLHGLEIEGPEFRIVHDDVAGVAPAAQEMAARMRRALPKWPGVLLEEKGPALALHTRNASSEDRAAAERRFRDIAAALGAGRFQMVMGDCVLELLPVSRWTKGDALVRIRTRAEGIHGRCFTVFAGDDVTDEDAFGAVGEEGLTIAVSYRPMGADVRVPGPEDVARLLRLLAAERTELSRHVS